MPRVLLNNRQNRLKDFSEFVVGRMRVNRITQETLAKKIGVQQPQFSKKIKQHQFSHEDMMILFKELEATDEEILRLMRY